MNRPRPSDIPDKNKFLTISKASVYMVANQMPNKQAYIKEVMGSSEYTTDKDIILSVENYNKLDAKYASKNKLRDKAQSVPQKRCGGCKRTRKIT